MVVARRGWPMWVRLLLMVGIPLAGMVVVVAPSLRDSVRVVAGTKVTEGRVAALNAVLEFRSSVGAEQVATEAAVRGQGFGVSLAVVSTILGFDVAGRISSSRASVDRGLGDATVQDLVSLAPFRASLAGLRVQVDAGTVDVQVLRSVFADAAQVLTVEADRELGVLVSGATTTSGLVGGVEAAIHRLVDVFDLVNAGRDEVAALFEGTMSATVADQSAGRTSLISARALYQRTVAAVGRSASPAVGAGLVVIRADPDVVAFDAAVDVQLASVGPVPGLLQLAATFRSGFVRSDGLDVLQHTAANEASAVAGLRRVQAGDRLRTQVVVMTSLVVATIVVALAIAWSITRRLRWLAARAERLSQGALDDPAVDEHGPRELAIVARALNEAAANLRLLESQASALANGDLDNPLLTVPAAGSLGEAIHATVARLLEAWRAGEQLQQRLAHQANHDLLTGLPNRKAALEGLEMALGRAHRHGDTIALLFVDLDDFKRANDAHGHHVGDRILQTCANRMQTEVRAGDLLARLGGDEFVIITERIGSVRDAVELSERLIATVSKPIEIDDLTIRVGASVGIGISLDGHATALDLLRDSDNAVHRAKNLGRGRVEIFDESARSELAAQTDLEAALRDALDNGDLRLHYQPVTDTITGELRGFEALARWTRDGVAITPDEFIPVAELSELINQLGCWALTEATNQLAEWTRDAMYPNAYVAVNISGRHLLSNDFVDDVRHALHTSGCDPLRLVIEITETVIVRDLITAVAHLNELRALGIRIAIDDFGTGYTSIGQLWRLPVDILKIDGSFIRDLEIGHDQIIVQLMIEVAHTLGLGLIAEGVETKSQQQALQHLNCDAIQGFLISKAQPPEQLALDPHLSLTPTRAPNTTTTPTPPPTT